uniref:Microtubule-associated protein MAP65-1a n=1 Tax=Oryza punctata TaxID=4537 RepID=A0A0E0M1W5_ORYPU
MGVGGGLGMETTNCGTLLRELQQIWAEVGESEGEKNKVLSEIERECLEVYRRKVDDANRTRVQLHQSVATKEAEVASLVAILGEHKLYLKKDKSVVPLKEQLAAVVPVLENLKGKKEERLKQFSDIQSQIEKIRSELSEYSDCDDKANSLIVDENDLSTRKLNNYQAQLRALQKEKSDRLHKVLEYVNEVHCLCGVLGIDFGKTVNGVHPSLHQNGLEQSTNISNSTLEGLAKTISNLKAERRSRIDKIRETMESLCKLWKLMDSPEEERRQFNRVLSVLISSEEDISSPGVLSQETIEKMDAEVERLTKLKARRLKEIFMKKRSELEEICRSAHIEPDASTAPEQTNEMIDSGMIDPSELLAKIESQILKAKEESLSRKDIMDRINKWISACDEEAWLEEYNQDSKRYSAGRGAHINLRRAEKARILDQKKLESILLKEKEAIFGSKGSPKRAVSLNRRTNGYRSSGTTSGLMTPNPRRSSLGGATPELLTPRSCSGHYNRYFSDSRRLSATQLNFGDDSLSTFTSISGQFIGVIAK